MATSATTLGGVTFDVILRTRSADPIEHVVGEITVPVRVSGLGSPQVDPADIEAALAGLGPDPTPARTRRGRRARKATR